MMTSVHRYWYGVMAVTTNDQMFPLLSPELFLRLILFTTNDYNLSIFTTNANVNPIDTPVTKISPPQN